MEEATTFKKLRENERELRKNLILDAALNLFEQKTFSKTGMRDIAKEVGVSTATLYSYFSSQEELFIEAFLRDLSIIDQILKEDLENTFSASDEGAMETLADKVVNHLMSSEATFQMISLLMTEGGMPEKLLEKFETLRDEFNKRIIKVLEISGLKNPDKTTSRAFFTSVLGAIMVYRNHPAKDMENPEESIKEIVRFIVRVYKAGIPAL